MTHPWSVSAPTNAPCEARKGCSGRPTRPNARSWAAIAAGALEVAGTTATPSATARRTAAAFADAISRPVHGVCSLDGLATTARAAGATGDLVVVTDARRREAYHARYSADGARTSGPMVGPAAGIDSDGVDHLAGDPVRLGEVTAAGHAAAGILEAVTAPDPAGLVTVAAPDLLAGTAPAPLEPLYLRRPDAVPPRRAAPSTALRGVRR